MNNGKLKERTEQFKDEYKSCEGCDKYKLQATPASRCHQCHNLSLYVSKQPEPPTPVKEKETHPSGHRYNSVENLIKDILFKEPPAPDISKGVWFHNRGGYGVFWEESPDNNDTFEIMVKGEKFVREENTPKDQQARAWRVVWNSCKDLGMTKTYRRPKDRVLAFIRELYENAKLVRRVAKLARKPVTPANLLFIWREISAIEVDAQRLHPETKGE